MKYGKIISTMFFFAILSADTDSATYHLSPNGIDSEQRGTQSVPWKTITYATGKMRGGDTLLLNGGTYTAETRIEIKNGGSATAWMVIKAAPGQKPIVDIGYYGPPSDLPKVVPDDTFRLPAGQPGRSQPDADQQRAIHIPVSNVLIEGLTVQGAHTAFWAANWNGTNSGLKISNCTIRYNEREALRLDHFNNVWMTGCKIYHGGLVNWPRTGAKNWPHAVIGWHADSVYIDSCEIHDNHGEGPGPFMWCSNWHVRHCTVYDNWSVNIYMDSDEGDHVVEGNMVYTTGRYGTTGRNMSDGIRVANELADLDYSSYGIAPDTTPAVSNMTILNNIIINTGGGICAYPYAPKYGFYLANSLIANNTITRIPSEYSPLRIVGDKVEIANNFIVECTKGELLTNKGGGIDFHDNLKASDGGFVDGTGYIAENYRLKSSSAAVNSGVVLTKVTKDYWGLSRPQGVRFDMGACEYQPPTRSAYPASIVEGMWLPFSPLAVFDISGRLIKVGRGRGLRIVTLTVEHHDRKSSRRPAITGR